jgi:hypothetical protein
MIMLFITNGVANDKKYSASGNSWRNKKLKDYEYVVKFSNPIYGPEAAGPFCVKVKNMNIVSVRYDSTAFVPDTATVPKDWWQEYSIEQFLNKINSAKEKHVKQINFEMDSSYGYPKYIYIDYDSVKVDDEILIKIYNFKAGNDKK